MVAKGSLGGAAADGEVLPRRAHDQERRRDGRPGQRQQERHPDQQQHCNCREGEDGNDQ
jgi:hypothetical protein